jgi:hypothetical protein
MNLVANNILDGCVQVDESNEQLEGDMEEESLEHSYEIDLVLWDMIPCVNLDEYDEVVDDLEGSPFCILKAII